MDACSGVQVVSYAAGMSIAMLLLIVVWIVSEVIARPKRGWVRRLRAIEAGRKAMAHDHQ